MTDVQPTDPEGALLLAVCAAPDADHGAAFHALRPDQWKRFLDLAEDQRVEMIARRAINRAQAAGAVPQDLARWLEEAHRRATFVTLQQRAALAAVLAVLRRAGFDPIALKGVRLANRDYPDPALRTLRDFDLLLPQREAQRAQELLLATPGYALADWAGHYGVEYGHQLPELRDVAREVTIEIHHRINARGWAQEPLLVEQLIESAEPLPLAGTTVRVPSAHANLLHLVEHATLHHLFDTGPQVLADLHFTAAVNTIDWALVEAAAERMGLGRALRLVAAIAARHGGDWVPQSLLAGDVPSPDALDLAEAGMLRGQDEREALADLRRLTRRTGAPLGPRAGVRALLRPNPSSLAAIAGTSAQSPWRWAAWPVWAAMRAFRFASSRKASSIAQEQAELWSWLHEG